MSQSENGHLSYARSFATHSAASDTSLYMYFVHSKITIKQHTGTKNQTQDEHSRMEFSSPTLRCVFFDVGNQDHEVSRATISTTQQYQTYTQLKCVDGIGVIRIRQCTACNGEIMMTMKKPKHMSYKQTNKHTKKLCKGGGTHTN